MKGLTEKQLNEYLTQRDIRVNGRLLEGRVFRGVIQNVQNSSGWLNFVTITRTEDQGRGIVDLTRYACYVPGYFPKKGDTVDLFYRSQDEAIVLQPVIAPNSNCFDFQLVTAAQASIRIPQQGSFPLTGFNNLRCVYTCKASSGASVQYLLCQIDGDTAIANYFVTEAKFVAGTVTSTDVNLGGLAQWEIGLVGRGDQLTNPARGKFEIPLFQITTVNLHFLAHANAVYSGSVNINEQRLLSGLHTAVLPRLPLDHLVLTSAGGLSFAPGSAFATYLEA